MTLVGGLLGAALLALLAWRLDWSRFAAALGSAEPAFVVATLAAIVAEQLLRAWKWGQLLRSLAYASFARLFGALMAGYLANLLVPVGLSPFVRAWLVAREGRVATSGVLATVTIDRLVDGLVYAGLVLFVVAATALPAAGGDLDRGLLIAASGSAAGLALAGGLLIRHKRQTAAGAGLALALARRLPARFAASAQTLLRGFAEGVVWPRAPWRGAAVVTAAVVVKLLAASHFFWAGLAFDVRLPPLAYLALLAVLGFVAVLSHLARVPAGFVVGAVFALSLFGVEETIAAAMVLVVMASNLIAVGVFGGWGLWLCGVRPAALLRRRRWPDECA